MTAQRDEANQTRCSWSSGLSAMYGGEGAQEPRRNE